MDPSRKALVSHTNSGTIPSTGGLGRPRFPEWISQRRRNFLTAQTCHTKNKTRKRNTKKKGLRSQHASEQRKANRTKRRSESRTFYRAYRQHVQKPRSGKTRPAGLSRLAQGTLQTPHPHQPALPGNDRLSNFHHYKVRYKQIANNNLERHNRKQHTSTVSWEQGSTLQIGTLNCRGLRGETSRAKKETHVYCMKCLKLDILFLQETHVNTNSTEVIAGFTFIYSTSITDEQRKHAENLRTTPRIDTEHGGVGAILTPLAQAALLDFNQIDGRLFTLTLDAVGPPMHFINAYAPQSGLDSRIKQEFYHKLEATFSSFPRAHPTFVLGDFNARLHAKFPHEIMIGPHIFGRGMQFLLENMSPITLENRSLFVEFCLAHDLVVGKTLFQKPLQKQVTFRKAGVSHGPPWTPDRYAQLDLFLIPERWKNSLTDVFSCVETFVESDHYIVKICLSIKRKGAAQAQRRTTFCKPTSEEYTGYNQRFSNSLTGFHTKNLDTVLASIRAGTTKLRPTPSGKRQKYLSDKIWQLILER